MEVALDGGGRVPKVKLWMGCAGVTRAGTLGGSGDVLVGNGGMASTLLGAH